MLCEDGRRESAHCAPNSEMQRSFLAPLAPDVGQDSGVKCNVDTAACLPPHFLPPLTLTLCAGIRWSMKSGAALLV